MNEAEFQHLMEESRRRRLTAGEEARLQAHFEPDSAARDLWDEETTLTRLLEELPDVPLATNFTAQVLLRGWTAGRIARGTLPGF